MVWKTKKEARWANIQLKCNMLYDWVIDSQLDRTIVTGFELLPYWEMAQALGPQH